MGALRAVRTLRIACEREEWIGRGRLLVEDALRVADLAPTRGRLLVIRRLDVGRIDPERPSGVVAARLEAAVEQAKRRAVRFDDPGAASADAVFFPEATTAPAALLLHLMAGRAADEWFWPLVLPAAGVREPSRTWSVRELVLSAAASMEPGAFVRLIHVLHASNRLDEVLPTLRPADGTDLMAALPASPSHDPEAEPAVPVPVEWARVLGTWVGRWGPADPRAAWLAAVALVHRRPGMLGHPRLRAQAAALSRRLAAQPAYPALPAGVDRPTPPAVNSPVPAAAVETAEAHCAPPPPIMSGPSVGASPIRRQGDARLHRAAAASCAGGIAGAGEGTLSEGSPADSPAPSSEAVGLQDSSAARQTAFGGFFFLLRVLDYLGIEPAHASSPWLLECDFARQTLRALARRSGVPDDDSAVLALRLHELPAAPPDVEPLVSAWSDAARRWCRASRMPWRRLVRRHAWVLTTPTHLDVVFDLRATDLRVRRLGLDTDPGWVAWLGVVVAYHYLEGGYRADASR